MLILCDCVLLCVCVASNCAFISACMCCALCYAAVRSSVNVCADIYVMIVAKSLSSVHDRCILSLSLSSSFSLSLTPVLKLDATNSKVKPLDYVFVFCIHIKQKKRNLLSHKLCVVLTPTGDHRSLQDSKQVVTMLSRFPLFLCSRSRSRAFWCHQIVCQTCGAKF